MADNNQSVSDSPQLKTTALCHIREAAAFLTGLNAISIVLNVIHIAVLKNIASLKGKSYLSALVVISCSDILHSTSAIIESNCNIPDYLPGDIRLWQLFTSVYQHSVTLFRFIAACLSSIERYVAVCKPFSQFCLINHLGKLAMFLGVMLAGTILGPTLMLYLLDGTNFSLKPDSNPVLEGLRVYRISIVWTTLITTVVTSTLILKEIRRMMGRAPANEDADLKKTSFYITVANSVFFILMLPAAIRPIIRAATLDGPESIEYRLYKMLSHAIYGLLNTVFYGFFFKAYRQNLKNMANWLFCKPPTSVHAIHIEPAH